MMMMTNPATPFLGRWRITYMVEWDQDYVDLVTTGYLKFDDDETGIFQFGTVQGFLDYRIQNVAKQNRIEFSWLGSNDTDPGSGRGWAVLEDGKLMRHIYIHMSDDSEFVAEKQR
jgi:hypothetical protein